jgi:hypothetical protein
MAKKKKNIGGRPPIYRCEMHSYKFNLPVCGIEEFRTVVAEFKAKYLIKK